MEEIQTVVRLQLGIVQRMLEKNDVRFTVTDQAVRHIAHLGYDPQFGARPIKRVIQRNLLNELSKMILAGEVTKEREIIVDEKDGSLIFLNR